MAAAHASIFSGQHAADAHWYACLQATVERTTPKARMAWVHAMSAATTPQQQRTLLFPQHGITAAEASLVIVEQDARARASKTAAERDARQRQRLEADGT